MCVLERQIVGNAETACNRNAASFELSQVFPSSLSTSVPLAILDWRSLYVI